MNAGAESAESPPFGWCWTTLGEVAEVVRNGLSVAPREIDGVRILRISAVRPMKLDLGDVRFLPGNENEYREFMIEEGDLLFTRYNGNPALVGACAVVPHLDGTVLHPDKLIRVRISGLNPSFICAGVSNGRSRRYLDSRVRSTAGQAGISGGDLKRTPILVAPAEEQVRVVEALDSYLTRLDAAAEGLRRVEANLKRYRASVLKAAVEGRLVPTEATLAKRERRTYEPASALLARILEERRRRWEATELAKLKAKGEPPKTDAWKSKYQDPSAPDPTNLPTLPEGWCWATLDALLRSPMRNGHSARESLDGRGIRTLTLTAVTAGDFSIDNTKVTGADPRVVDDLWLEPEDILVERSNTPELVGTTCMYRGPAGFSIFPDLLIRVRTTKQVSADFVEIALMSPFSREYFTKRAQGIAGSMPKVSQDVVGAIPVPLPPAAEAVRIALESARCLSVGKELAAQNQQNAARCSRLRQSILTWAFEGKLVDQDPNDEPASVLLARIRAQRDAVETTRRTGKAARRMSAKTRA